MGLRSERLRDHYFYHRRTCEPLRAIGHLFEGQEWHTVGKTEVRNSKNGWKLLVYDCEDTIEINVIEPDGTSSKY